MAAVGLFSSGRTSRQQSNLIEFKAGKMYVSGKMCHADKRKGLLYAYRGEDSLLHICWKDRTTGLVQDDLILFTEDAVFKRVEECTSGRVYVLLLKSSKRKYIFWMQEAKVDKDEENCKKLNEILSGLTNPESSAPSASSLSDLASESDLQSLLNSLNQQQLLRLLGNATSSLGGWQAPPVASRDQSPDSLALPRSTRSAGTASPQRIRPSTRTDNISVEAGVAASAKSVTSAVAATRATIDSDLPTASANLSMTEEHIDSAAGTSAGTSGREAPSSLSAQNKTPSIISLGDLKNILSGINAEQWSGLKDALLADVVVPILAADPNAVQLLVDLLPPHGQDWPPKNAGAIEELRSTLSAPQFIQALTSFSQAFTSGQLAPVFGQFHLPEPCLEAANRGDLENFAKALQEHCALIRNSKRKSDAEGL